MSEVPVTLASGVIGIPWPEARIREYCRREVYVGYDDFHAVDDVVSPRDVGASRRLGSEIQVKEAQFLVNSRGIQRLLAKTPDADPLTTTEDEWGEARSLAAALIDEFTVIPGVTLAKAGKILHLKRPHLFPTMDGVTVEALTGVNLRGVPKRRQREIALRVIDITRRDLQSNGGAFAILREKLRDLPIPLTPTRMHDILAWTYLKWDTQHNLLATRYEPTGLGYKPVKSTVKETLINPPERKAETLKPLTKKEVQYEPDGVNLIKVESMEQFDKLIFDFAGYIIIRDSVKAKIHKISCKHVQRSSFKTKVVDGKGKKGEYYWCSSVREGERLGAARCAACLIPG